MNRVEEMARAMFEERRAKYKIKDDTWEDRGAMIQQDWLDSARTALQNMRKPSPAMLKAACAAMSPGKRPTKNRVSVKAKHGIRYRAMIDAILNED